MKKYTVAIEETIVQEFEIWVQDNDDVIDVAVQKYKAAELVLEPGEPQFRQLAIMKPNDETTEWIEF